MAPSLRLSRKFLRIGTTALIAILAAGGTFRYLEMGRTLRAKECNQCDATAGVARFETMESKTGAMIGTPNRETLDKQASKHMCPLHDVAIMVHVGPGSAELLSLGILMTSISLFVPCFESLNIFRSANISVENLSVALGSLEPLTTIWSLDETAISHVVRDSGWLRQWSRMWSDNFTRATYFMFMDSDTIFNRPVTRDTFFNDIGLPVWYYWPESESYMKEAHVALGSDSVQYSFTTYYPFFIPREAFSTARELMTVRWQTATFDEAFRNAVTTFPSFSEFNVLGNALFSHKRESFDPRPCFTTDTISVNSTARRLSKSCLDVSFPALHLPYPYAIVLDQSLSDAGVSWRLNKARDNPLEYLERASKSIAHGVCFKNFYMTGKISNNCRQMRFTEIEESSLAYTQNFSGADLVKMTSLITKSYASQRFKGFYIRNVPVHLQRPLWITTISSSHRPWVINWVYHLQMAVPGVEYLIFGLDDDVCEWLEIRGYKVSRFFLSQFENWKRDGNWYGVAKFVAAQKAMHEGRDVIISDSDVVVLHDLMDVVRSDADIQAQLDGIDDEDTSRHYFDTSLYRSIVNIGLMYMKSNEVNLDFLRRYLLQKKIEPDKWDQQLFTDMLIRDIGIGSKSVPKVHFFALNHVTPSPVFHKFQNESYAVHVNGLKANEKLQFMKDAGLWFEHKIDPVRNITETFKAAQGD
mmetsp:Transcript_2967/g.10733  ORF Transcript_2967/g.10733 Transcript_2967/m.10733 type:complete len:698 (-) Transcript_2967:270-2363(-)|eukprot:CAMPEP_0174578288 /NCGR_PEP_ID=MMETSP0929-20130131/697_1 /TAXON_ID=548131 ORGANISM="Ostreococcus mediterraneus, Strain clade-D-RCC2572" /NCGR_SAMPLE_ID=MMETSP0929 /ASSEMBLY_ACC=CAM_ASM_000573 /LENGTH=697 /DNA_ID=CAMNT_0015759351 /DNA_START=212 /DNA_END=2305 /DNA_ORIENTATION=+